MHVLLMYSTHPATARHVERLRGIDPSIRVTVADTLETALAAAPTANVMLGHRFLSQCLPHASSLRWVQSTAQGVDRLPLASLRQKGVQLSCMASSTPVIARHAMALAWSLARCLPQALARQAAGAWDADLPWLPWPRRAFVIGAGRIGCELARMLVADGLAVAGAKRSLRAGAAPPPGFERIYDRASWREGLAAADWCFLALPNTDETLGLVDEAALRALPPHALLINVGRGETLDTAALCRVLREGHLGGAALDVVHPRPRGPDDPIWNTPRLVITPHCASHHLERSAAIERFCEDQLARHLAGSAVLHLITHAWGDR